jgi:hypothetical protein
VSEAEARATLDDQPIGFSGSERLPPGPHHLRVERPDFASYERDVTLMPGRETSVDVRLLPTPEFRASYLSHAHRTLWIAAGLGGAGLASAVGGAIALGVTVNDLSQLVAVARDPTGAGVAGAVTAIGFVLLVTGTAMFVSAPSLDRFEHPHWQSRVRPGPTGVEIAF